MSIVLVVSYTELASFAYIDRGIRTQVEVVLKAVANSHQTEDHMPDCCEIVSMVLESSSFLPSRF